MSYILSVIQQAALPSYEEALRDTTTTSAPATTETTTSIDNATGNGNAAINGDPNVDSIHYRKPNLDGSENGGIDRVNNLNMPPLLDGIPNEVNSNLQPMHQRDAMNRRQTVQLPIIATSNDNIDMVDTPTSENSHSIAGGNSLMSLQVILHGLIF